MNDKWAVVVISRLNKPAVLTTHRWRWTAIIWGFVFTLAYDGYMEAVDVWRLSD